MLHRVLDLDRCGPGYTVPADFNPVFIHKKGALAAARQPDQVNPEKASSGSQFYIAQGKTWTDAEIDQTQQKPGGPIQMNNVKPI